MYNLPKLLFISAVSTPQQVKLCYALQKYFNAEFWFYESAERSRGKFWDIELGEHCKIIPHSLFFKSGIFDCKYIAPGLTKAIEKFNPDIIMLGGFSIPSNMIAYSWAKKHDRQTIVFTERSRNHKGKLRKRGFNWNFLYWYYRNVDLILTSSEDVVEQFRDEFGFGDKVVAARYASDLDSYFLHKIRIAKPGYTYLFANRLISIYNPLLALKIFAQVLDIHPSSRLLMNAAGELYSECCVLIEKLNISHAVEFLTQIHSWNELHLIYAKSDILLLPANFSNGNFTLYEAMASGMGIVVSNHVLGNGQEIQDGLNGFNCEPTISNFLERIEKYIDNPNLFEQHAKINRDIVKPLSIDGTAEFIADIIKKHLNI